MPLTLPSAAARQQGNEGVLKDQVRQQFRMNMHEEDEEKVCEGWGVWGVGGDALPAQPRTLCSGPEVMAPSALWAAGCTGSCSGLEAHAPGDALTTAALLAPRRSSSRRKRERLCAQPLASLSPAAACAALPGHASSARSGSSRPAGSRGS